MREKYVVLRIPGSRVYRYDPETGSSMPSFSPSRDGGIELDERLGTAGLVVEIEEVDSKARARKLDTLSRSGDVLAFAPAVPMRLIAPFSANKKRSLGTGKVAWGIQAVGADTSHCSGDGIVVAVLDTGIDPTHAAFHGVDLVTRDFTGEGDGDMDGHGTHCAGTILGRDVDGIRIGVATGVKKALIGKVSGTTGATSDALVSAIQWAMQNGANVISMSLGIDFPGMVGRLKDLGWPVELATSRALEGYRANVQLFERLTSLIRTQGAYPQAAVVVAAAGNESRRLKHPDFRIAVTPPAVAEGIISVAALGKSKNGFVVAHFSNRGADVSGPGVDIISAKVGGSLVPFSGTSMATPHVAGLAALWAEWLIGRKFFTTSALTSMLTSSGDIRGMEPGYDVFDIGFGMLRAPQPDDNP